MKNLIIALIATLLLASCGHYPDGTSVWGGGMFLIFWLPLIGAAIFGYLGYKSWKSGTKTGGSSSNPTVTTSSERLEPWKVWQWVFAAILLVFAIVVLITQNADK